MDLKRSKENSEFIHWKWDERGRNFASIEKIYISNCLRKIGERERERVSREINRLFGNFEWRHFLHFRTYNIIVLLIVLFWVTCLSCPKSSKDILWQRATLTQPFFSFSSICWPFSMGIFRFLQFWKKHVQIQN